MTSDDRPVAVRADHPERSDRPRLDPPGFLIGGGPRSRRWSIGRLLALIRAAGPAQTVPSCDRDWGLGTCRWCLNVVTLRSRRSAGWVHLATGHAVCVDPPMGAPLTCTAQPLPAAPHRWDVLFPADHRRARLFWTLGTIGAADPTTPMTSPHDNRAAGPAGPPPIGAA